MSEGYETVRSYQRIFRPERRLYSVDGRALPVPGGVPLRWLGWALGTLLAALALASAWIAGIALTALDWPLRLVVVPVAVATFATQATPDGRRAERFALSWLALRLLPARRSLGRALPAVGRAQAVEGSIWVAADERSPRLRRGRVRGPAVVSFAAPVAVRRSGRRRAIARPDGGRAHRRGARTARIALGGGEVLEVRP